MEQKNKLERIKEIYGEKSMTSKFLCWISKKRKKSNVDKILELNKKSSEEGLERQNRAITREDEGKDEQQEI